MGSSLMRFALAAALVAVLVGASGAGARTLAGDGGLHRVAGGAAADAEFVSGQVDRPVPLGCLGRRAGQVGGRARRARRPRASASRA